MKNASYKSVPREFGPQDCPTRVTYNPQGCPTKVLHKSATKISHMSRKSVPQSVLCSTRQFHKSCKNVAPHECLTRVSHESVPQECPTKMSEKNVLQAQECPTTSQSVHKGFRKECIAQECSRTVWVFVFKPVFAFGFVGFLFCLSSVCLLLWVAPCSSCGVSCKRINRSLANTCHHFSNGHRISRIGGKTRQDSTKPSFVAHLQQEDNSISFPPPGHEAPVVLRIVCSGHRLYLPTVAGPLVAM